MINIKNLLLLGLIIIPIIFFPSYQMYSTTKFSYIYLTLATACITGLIDKKKFFIPVFPRLIGLLIISLVVLYFFSMLFNLPGHYFIPVSNWIVFFSIVLFSYNYVPMEKGEFDFNLEFWINVSTVPVLLLSCVQMFDLLTWPTTGLIGSFGNRNFLAFYLGISILIQFFLLKEKSKLYQLFVLGLTFFVLYQTSCRSALVAVLFSITILFVWILSFRSKMTIIALLALSVFLTIVSFKKITFDIRYHMALNAISMILDRPFIGFGPGNYVSVHGEYNHKASKKILMSDVQMESHPHNTYLETMVENGIPFTVLLTILLFVLFYKLSRAPPENDIYGSKGLFISLFVYMVVNLFFTFALQRPTVFYFVAFFLGQLLSFLNFEKKQIKNFEIFFICLFFLFLHLGNKRFFSHRNFYKHGTDIKYITRSCEDWPNQWIFCMRKGEIELLIHKQYEEAEKTFKDILLYYPGLYVATGELARTYCYQGKRKKCCQLFKKYKHSLQRESFLDGLIKQACGNGH